MIHEASNQQGLTLLEVLVAIAIFAAAAVACSNGLGQAFAHQHRAANLSQAVIHAESILARVSTGAITSGVSRGRIDDDYHWVVELKPYAKSEFAQTAIMQASATVYWHDGLADREFGLSSLVLPREPQQ